MVKIGSLFTARKAAGLAMFSVTILALSSPAAAQPGMASGTASANGASRAEIIEPLSVAALENLNFGAIAVQPGRAGSVTITAAPQAASYQGAAQSMCITSVCAVHPARFRVNGERDRNYVIILPAEISARAVTGGGSQLLVTDLTTSSLNLPGASKRGRLDGAGVDEVLIGGTLQIPAGTPSGTYQAEIRLVVIYD